MIYRILFILFIIYWPNSPVALAQDQQRYRVELLVLRNLQGIADLSPQATLRDFSAALDLLAPPADVTVEEPAAAEEATRRADAAGQATPGQAVEAAETESEPEPQAVLVEAQSDIMQRAWQRLRSSSAYRPELYFSWEQADVEPFPAIRLHDQEILREEDPAADTRFTPQNHGADEVPTFTDTSTPAGKLAGTGGDGAAPDAAAAVIPQPVRFYRIDGTASLRKSRFLHLDLDIEFREPVFADDARAQADMNAIPPYGATPYPSAFLVNTLQQSRQVQTQEMEYFDGPVFAVLAMVSRVEAVPDPEAEVSPDAR